MWNFTAGAVKPVKADGEMTGDPKAFGQKDAHAFANQLNAFLAKHH